MDEVGQQNADCGFKADDAIGRVGKCTQFFPRRMGCVVRGERVYGAVLQARDDGLAICFRTQWRTHFARGAQDTHVFIG